MTHPLERLKRIADETIRKQAIENFSQDYYDENCKKDNGTISFAIVWSFEWWSSPQEYDYWKNIYYLAKEGKLELLPEPIEDNPTLGDKTSLANVDIYEQNTQLKLENEKLREFSDLLLKAYKSFNTAFPFSALDIEIDTQAKQLLNQLEK